LDERLPLKKWSEASKIHYKIRNCQTKISICLVGDTKTNKTRFIYSLFNRYDQYQPNTSFGNEYGALLNYKLKNGEEKTVSISIFDTSGLEDYDRMRPKLYFDIDFFM
jgi:GTPase SAR1 family protein